MRGAPQRGLLRLNIRIRSRTSCGTLRRPGLPRRIRHLQNKRKPLRCQAMTVSALTIVIRVRKSRTALIPFWSETMPAKPSTRGGANWPPSSYDPTTNYLYVCGTDRVGLFKGGDEIEAFPGA